MLRHWVPLWTIPTLMVFATGTVWLRLAIIRKTFTIHQLDHEIELMRQDRELLQVKMSALKSPRRLEGLARTRFGLSQPRADQIVHFRIPREN